MNLRDFLPADCPVTGLATDSEFVATILGIKQAAEVIESTVTSPNATSQACQELIAEAAKYIQNRSRDANKLVADSIVRTFCFGLAAGLVLALVIESVTK